MKRALETEIPQSPRFAVQRLVGDRWETITFDDGDDDDPYHGQPLLYQSRYVAEHIADAAYVVNKWLFKRIVNFGSQPSHRRFNYVSAGFKVDVPDLFDNPGARDDLSG